MYSPMQMQEEAKLGGICFEIPSKQDFSKYKNNKIVLLTKATKSSKYSSCE